MGSRGAVIGVLLVVALLVAAVLVWWFRQGPREVEFVEVTFELGFAPPAETATPSPARLGRGYWFEPTKASGSEEPTEQAPPSLHPAMDEALPHGGPVVGIGLYRPEAHPPAELQRSLRVAEGSVLTVRLAESGLIERSDLYAALAQDAVAEISANEGGCTASLDGSQLELAVGESGHGPVASRSLGLDEAIAAIRALRDDLPDPDEIDRELLALRLDPDGDGRIEVHQTTHVACRGRVLLHPDDLLQRLRETRDALDRGDLETAGRELAALEAVVGRDPAVRGLRARLDRAPTDSAALAGVVVRPPGADTRTLVEISVWPSGAGPEETLLQMPALGDRFRLSLPAGDYEIECWADGVGSGQVSVHLPQDDEVQCALR